jgi:hypothetical protein
MAAKAANTVVANPLHGEAPAAAAPAATAAAPAAPPVRSSGSSSMPLSWLCAACARRPSADYPASDASHSILANFMRLALSFSANHAVAVTALALASAALGPKLGSYGVGVLYAGFTVSALLFAPAVVRTLGPRRAMVLSLSLYCAYVGSFIGGLALVRARGTDDELTWAVVLSGAVVGGVGAGWMWTAQGAYFTAAARAFAVAAAAAADGGAGATGAGHADASAASSTASVASGVGRSADAKRREREKAATSHFSGLFGFWYLSLEVLVKVTVSLVMGIVAHGSSSHADGGSGSGSSGGSYEGTMCAFAAMLGVAVAATAAMHLGVWEDPGGGAPTAGGGGGGGGGGDGGARLMQESGKEEQQEPAGVPRARMSSLEMEPTVPAALLAPPRKGDSKGDGKGSGAHGGMFSLRRLLIAVELLRRPNRYMLLLAPFQIAFGFMSALLIVFINGSVAKDDVGTDAIGYLTAILAGVAALLSPVFATLGATKGVGKTPVMLLGAGAWLLEATLLRAISPGAFMAAGWAGLVPLYVLHGVGRVVYETTNKAMVADLFGETGDTEAAFANVIVFTGSSSAVALFLFPSLGHDQLASVCIGTLAFAALCLVALQRRRRAEKRSAETA